MGVRNDGTIDGSRVVRDRPWEKQMSDDKTKVGSADRSRVNVHEDYELKYWTQKFGCTAEELKAAVQAVGPSVKAVEQYLKNPGKDPR